MSAVTIKDAGSFFRDLGSKISRVPSIIDDYKNQFLDTFKEGVTPFKACSVVGYSVLSLVHIGMNIRLAAKMKGHYKLIPSLKILSSTGDLMGEVGKGLLLIASKTPTLLKALQFASTTLGTASVALQVFGLAANVWEAVSVRKQIREFDAVKRDNPHMALRGIRSKLGDRRVFRIVSKKQSRFIKKILQKEPPMSNKVILATNVIEKHTKASRALQIVKMALNIIMVVGLLLLMFAPTPAAPILLSVMMGAMAISFITMIASSIMKSRCNHKLKAIAA